MRPTVVQQRTRHHVLTALGAMVVAAAAATVVVTVRVDALAPARSGAADTAVTVSVTAAPPTTDAPTTTAAPTTTTTALTTTTTTAPTTTVRVADGSVDESSDPAAILALQQRLQELRYWVGAPDGRWGRVTAQAVLAFQKAEGLARDGKAGPVTMAHLAAAGVPQPARLDDGVEISLDRQLIFLVRSGAVEWVINTSTGTSRTPTPRGDFTVQREIDGVRRAPLGDLYRPKYFHRGIAVHGSPSIPGYPASHGCARVSNAAMDFLWSSGLIEVGTPVRVV